VTNVNQEDLNRSLEVLGLAVPVTQEELAARRRELLQTWLPARYANLTNNPKKYMQMFKQAEEMTRKIEMASKVVNDWLTSPDNRSS
jgi:hypothetical protein